MAAANTSGKVRIPKTSEVVADALRTEIVDGSIPEGASLPSEAALIQRFGVSRPSIREAFRILESEQLIIVVRGSLGGARAARPQIGVAARYMAVLMQYNQVELSDVFAARSLIEPMAFTLLAQRRNRASLVKQLRHIVDNLGDDLDVNEAADQVVRFMKSLFEFADNKTLSLVYGTLTEVLRHEVVELFGAEWNQIEAARLRLHEVLDIVAQGDGDAAAAMWSDRMRSVTTRVARVHRGKTVDADYSA